MYFGDISILVHKQFPHSFLPSFSFFNKITADSQHSTAWISKNVFIFLETIISIFPAGLFSAFNVLAYSGVCTYIV